MAKKLTQGEFQDFMIEQIGALQHDVSALRKEVGAVGRKVDQVELALAPLAAAIDKDAETIIEHDRRLTRIEKHVELRRA